MKKLNKLPGSLEDMTIRMQKGEYNGYVAALLGKTECGTYIVTVPTGNWHILEVKESDFEYLNKQARNSLRND